MDEMLNLALEEQKDDPRASLNLPAPGSPYRLLKARKTPRLPAKLPRRKITLHLTGDMNRYIWSFDGKTMAQQPYVLIKKGEIIELELVNDSMMHHPIHLHGHFFRLLMGNGARSPLKHTVDVPPMSNAPSSLRPMKPRLDVSLPHPLPHDERHGPRLPV
jgi:FtsP/CotA-like multicopper oxidase with cupredoxin domain